MSKRDRVRWRMCTATPQPLVRWVQSHPRYHVYHDLQTSNLCFSVLGGGGKACGHFRHLQTVLSTGGREGEHYNLQFLKCFLFDFSCPRLSAGTQVKECTVHHQPTTASRTNTRPACHCRLAKREERRTTESGWEVHQIQ